MVPDNSSQTRFPRCQIHLEATIFLFPQSHKKCHNFIICSLKKNNFLYFLCLNVLPNNFFIGLLVPALWDDNVFLFTFDQCLWLCKLLKICSTLEILFVLSFFTWKSSYMFVSLWCFFPDSSILFLRTSWGVQGEGLYSFKQMYTARNNVIYFPWRVMGLCYHQVSVLYELHSTGSAGISCYVCSSPGLADFLASPLLLACLRAFSQVFSAFTKCSLHIFPLPLFYVAVYNIGLICLKTWLVFWGCFYF